MKKKLYMALLCLFLATATLFAQPSKSDNALLWKVSGKGLSQPSFLFGTYHFLTNAFIDTMPAIKAAYASSKAIVGELVIDSALQPSVMQAALLNGTTLKQLLPDTLYAKAAAWFRSEAGMDLAMLNNFNPITVMTLAMAITQQKYFPNKPGEVQLDTYFQQEGKKDGKKILGLETVDVQINALYKQLTLQRQVEMLDELFKDRLKQSIDKMNNAYISQDMDQLQKEMYNGSYKPEEIKVLLDDRNNHWVQELLGIMQQQPVFVAVGALHLVGKNGLVNQLRAQGFTVTPLNTKGE
jgi:uncharacterized protein YbaP (TraB family)